MSATSLQDLLDDAESPVTMLRNSQTGSRAYSSNALESGWIPSPLPAVYSSEALPHPEERAKFIDWPSAVYCMHPFDHVVDDDGETAGVSTWIGYSANEGKLLTLATLDPGHAEPGTRVTLIWGEENGGTRKPTVERHVQIEIRATVHPAPYVSQVRTAYAPSGWRDGSA